MGKQRRARQKYHLACKRAAEKASAETESKPEETPNPPLSWKVVTDDNLFAGIDIDVSGLSKMEMDDDVKSVRSISKSIKSSIKQSGGKLMKKQEKMKLRHNLFIEKIDAVYKKLAEFKKKKPRGKVNMRDLVMTDTQIPTSKKVEFLLNKKTKKVAKECPVSKKSKGIKKASQRTKQMLTDLEAFKKAISQKGSENALEHVTGLIEKKVFSGVL